MGPDGFANPWEHARLLSDRPRNQAMVDVIGRHAPGHRVLEIGCGSGLLSIVAARAGATRVYGVEPTGLADVARELVAANGLADRVEILDGRVEDLSPRPVDLAFSELLNADPFFEGVVSAMAAGADWVVPGGLLAPRRLVVKVALARVPDSAREVRAARSELQRLAGAFDIRVDPILELLQTDEPYVYMTEQVQIVSEPVVAFDVVLGQAADDPEQAEVLLEVTEPGPVAGAVAWFEAEMMDGLTLGNPPGAGGHWGQLVCAFADERGHSVGAKVGLTVHIDEGSLEIRRR